MFTLDTQIQKHKLSGVLQLLGKRPPQRKCYSSVPAGRVSPMQVLKFRWRDILAASSQGIPRNHTAQQTSYKRFIGREKTRRVSASVGGWGAARFLGLVSSTNLERNTGISGFCFLALVWLGLGVISGSGRFPTSRDSSFKKKFGFFFNQMKIS